jgi:hypothetical protein
MEIAYALTMTSHGTIQLKRTKCAKHRGTSTDAKKVCRNRKHGNRYRSVTENIRKFSLLGHYHHRVNL